MSETNVNGYRLAVQEKREEVARLLTEIEVLETTIEELDPKPVVKKSQKPTAKAK